MMGVKVKTDEEVHEMYLDWFNNFLSTEKFREYYDLGMAETENILDRGWKIQNEINKQINNSINRIKKYDNE